MTPPSRILVTPRWGGTPEDDWYRWLFDAVPGIELVPLPDPGAPTPERCAEVFGAALASGDPARTFLLGHSVSCQGWLHALARTEVAVAGFLGVAAWWSVDRPWPTLMPWVEASLDTLALRPKLGRVRVLLGEQDPYTSDQRTNAAQWEERLGATTCIVAGAAHFNGKEEPEVLAELRALIES